MTDVQSRPLGFISAFQANILAPAHKALGRWMLPPFSRADRCCCGGQTGADDLESMLNAFGYEGETDFRETFGEPALRWAFHTSMVCMKTDAIRPLNGEAYAWLLANASDFFAEYFVTIGRPLHPDQ